MATKTKKPITTKSKASGSKKAPIKTLEAKKPASLAAKILREPTHEEIATRAYFISQSAQAGSAFENWVRAEAELKAQK